VFVITTVTTLNLTAVNHCKVCFLLGKSVASGFYMPTFRNTLFHLRMQVGVKIHSSHLPAYEVGTDSVPKRRHIDFRRQGITQKKAYNFQNKAKV